jgi:SpoVK/Ycf46/Vps4 family AAA+-type ATPase
MPRNPVRHTGPGACGRSTRVTESFTQAAARAKSIGRGLLIIDEADDLGTSRSQMQAHHEDRAGVNVLIKQIDQLSTIATPMAVIMITNRADAVDPAVIRRAALQLHFERPSDETRAAIFRRMLEGTKATEAQIRELVTLTKRGVPYTSSDLTDRIAGLALRRAWKSNQAFGPAAVKACISEVAPSPLMQMAAKK